MKTCWICDKPTEHDDDARCPKCQHDLAELVALLASTPIVVKEMWDAA